MKEVARVEAIMRALPMAADHWLMVIVLIHVFGKPIPWYAWTMLALEVLVTIAAGVRVKKLS